MHMCQCLTFFLSNHNFKKSKNIFKKKFLGPDLGKTKK